MKIKNFTIGIGDEDTAFLFIRKYFSDFTDKYLNINRHFACITIENNSISGANHKDKINHFILNDDTYPFVCDFYEKMIKYNDDTIEIVEEIKPNTMTAQEFVFMFKQNPPPHLRRGQWFMVELAKINPGLYEDVSQTDLDCFAKHIIPLETIDYIMINWDNYLNENTSKTIEQKYHDLLEENTKLKQIIYNIKNLVQ